jgi:hypothetical protein
LSILARELGAVVDFYVMGVGIVVAEALIAARLLTCSPARPG